MKALPLAALTVAAGFSASALAAPALAAPAQVGPVLELGAAWGDHAVIQRDRPIVVEGTGFTCGGGARLTVQHVPASIYRASYPCWFLDRAGLLAVLATHYRLAWELPSPGPAPEGGEFRSLVLERTGGAP